LRSAEHRIVPDAWSGINNVAWSAPVRIDAQPVVLE
jgi:hypothetical protein